MDRRSRTKRKVRRYGSRQPYTARASYRNKAFAGPTKAIVAPSVGLGQSARTVLKTSFYANVNCGSTTGVFTGYLNPGSCFDPTGDIATIQPALYDQWSTIYGRYVVEKAFIRIEVTPAATLSTESQYAAVVAAYPSVNNSALANFQGAASQPWSKTLCIGSYSDTTNTNSMTFVLDHAKVLGKNDRVTAEDNGALVGANPPTGEFMTLPIFIQTSQVPNRTVPYLLKVVIYQHVRFDRRSNVVDT